MSYLRDMKLFGATVQKRWSAIALAAALAVSACAGSTATPETTTNNAEPDTTSTTAAANQPDSVEGAPAQDDAVSLGEREAGFGRGSFVVLAGQYIDRLEEVDGDWFPGPPLPLNPPAVCAIPEPAAVQGLILVRPIDQSGVRGDVISAEVRVYETAEEAEALVGLVNGDSAEECDRASLDLALESPTPGVTFDFGDGVGEPGAVPESLPAGILADSRNYDFEIVFGSVGEALVQRATVAVVDNAVISFSVSSSAEVINDLEAEVVNALFDEPVPELITRPDLDAAIDDVRRSVLLDSDLPDFYDPSLAMFIGGPGNPDVCFTADPPVAATFGPSWLAVSPGIGASEISQGSRIYGDSEAATLAFEEVSSVGLECFPEELELPDGFELVARESELVVIDGVTVVHVELDYNQRVGVQMFDVEAKIAVAQFDEMITSVRFFGLAGDAPDIAELAALTAQRGGGNDQ